MRVLVTGATGWIGRGLVSDLLREKHEVCVLSRSAKRAQESLVGCRCFEWPSPEIAPPPAESLEGVDSVIHLAGEPVAAARWSREQKKRILESRALSTRNLMQAIRDRNTRPNTVVCASAIGFYGDTGDRVVDEDSAAGTDFLAQVCTRWEAELREGAPAGMYVCSVRIGFVLGSGGGPLERILKPFRMGLGGPLGDGRQWISWIHYSDAIGILTHAIGLKSPPPALNAVSPHPVDNEKFSRTLASVLGTVCRLRVPAAALKIALGEMASLALESQRVLPKRTLETGYPFRFTDLEVALKDAVPAS